MLRDEREAYEEFFKAFGIQLKFGIYNDYGAHKETLRDLLIFRSSNEKKYVTLKEYVSRMKEGRILSIMPAARQTKRLYAAADRRGKG